MRLVTAKAAGRWSPQNSLGSGSRGKRARGQGAVVVSSIERLTGPQDGLVVARNGGSPWRFVVVTALVIVLMACALGWVTFQSDPGAWTSAGRRTRAPSSISDRRDQELPPKSLWLFCATVSPCSCPRWSSASCPTGIVLTLLFLGVVPIFKLSAHSLHDGAHSFDVFDGMTIRETVGPRSPQLHAWSKVFRPFSVRTTSCARL